MDRHTKTHWYTQYKIQKCFLVYTKIKGRTQCSTKKQVCCGLLDDILGRKKNSNKCFYKFYKPYRVRTKKLIIICSLHTRFLDASLKKTEGRKWSISYHYIQEITITPFIQGEHGFKQHQSKVISRWAFKILLSRITVSMCMCAYVCLYSLYWKPLSHESKKMIKLQYFENNVYL